MCCQHASSKLERMKQHQNKTQQSRKQSSKVEEISETTNEQSVCFHDFREFYVDYSVGDRRCDLIVQCRRRRDSRCCGSNPGNQGLWPGVRFPLPSPAVPGVPLEGQVGPLTKCSYLFRLFTSLRDGNRPRRMEGDNISTEPRKEARQ